MTPAQILTAAELCHLAYEPELPEGFRRVGDMRYGIFGVGGERYLVIPGTRNAMNVIRDIWVRPTRTARGHWVHKGFYSAFEKIAKECAPQVTANTVAVGHSLGGAVALLFAEALGCRAITFGCPRAFMRLFTPPAGINHYRVVCDDDPVPAIPWLMFRHIHEAGLTLADRDGELIDVKDHSMAVYRRRIRRRFKHVQAVPALVAAPA